MRRTCAKTASVVLNSARSAKRAVLTVAVPVSLTLHLYNSSRTMTTLMTTDQWNGSANNWAGTHCDPTPIVTGAPAVRSYPRTEAAAVPLSRLPISQGGRTPAA
mmetsp:Transcript_6842/g.22012  ORF Transcript_6842/g.22012 Transcript_6842/m.22012 type:complete len:104 (-) Transcript_6842:166-477(-)